MIVPACAPPRPAIRPPMKKPIPPTVPMTDPNRGPREGDVVHQPLEAERDGDGGVRGEERETADGEDDEAPPVLARQRASNPVGPSRIRRGSGSPSPGAPGKGGGAARWRWRRRATAMTGHRDGPEGARRGRSRRRSCHPPHRWTGRKHLWGELLDDEDYGQDPDRVVPIRTRACRPAKTRLAGRRGRWRRCRHQDGEGEKGAATPEPVTAQREGECEEGTEPGDGEETAHLPLCHLEAEPHKGRVLITCAWAKPCITAATHITAETRRSSRVKADTGSG